MKADKNEVQPLSAGDATTEGAEDILNVLRKLAVIPASEIPDTPPKFEPVPVLVKRTYIRMAETQGAEVREGLTEVSGKGPQLAKDLGSFAPSPKRR